jgi:replicative DNA helicase
LGGLQKSDLVILAGRPSMGKTALATNMGFNAAEAEGDPETGSRFHVAFFSLEMSSEQLATRILAEKSGISSDRIRRGDVKSEDFTRIVEASQKMNSAPFFIDDTPAITVPMLRTRARRLKRQHGLDLIIIDYLQLMRSEGRIENRVEAVGQMSRGLKGLARELGVPVIALSQLSRAVEQRAQNDKKPVLSDLRESGAIEQDADLVMFIYRDEYYNKDSERPGEADIIIAKHRNGPIGEVVLTFRHDFPKFMNYAGDRFQ